MAGTCKESTFLILPVVSRYLQYTPSSLEIATDGGQSLQNYYKEDVVKQVMTYTH